MIECTSMWMMKLKVALDYSMSVWMLPGVKSGRNAQVCEWSSRAAAAWRETEAGSAGKRHIWQVGPRFSLTPVDPTPKVWAPVDCVGAVYPRLLQIWNWTPVEPMLSKVNSSVDWSKRRLIARSDLHLWSPVDPMLWLLNTSVERLKLDWAEPQLSNAG